VKGNSALIGVIDMAKVANYMTYNSNAQHFLASTVHVSVTDITIAGALNRLKHYYRGETEQYKALIQVFISLVPLSIDADEYTISLMLPDVADAILLSAESLFPVEDVEVFIWPDASWCYVDQYDEHEYRFKGDDFFKARVNNLEIDLQVQSLV
jgi:hypothetical protein